MNEELKSFSEKCADDIQYATTSQEFSRVDRIEVGRALYNLGYRKTIWHKIADNDLPTDIEWKIIYYHQYPTEGSGTAYIAAYYSQIFDSFITPGLDHPFIAIDRVIAWTDCPKFEE